MHERNRPARVSDDLPPIGFWSYTTSDDTSSRGKLSQLRRLLADELQQKVGRRSKVLIWQDANAIPHGATWEEEIHKGIDGSSFFIPIVTPAFLESEWCCYEAMRFHDLERQRGRNDLIFPLHYVDTDDFHPEEAHDPQVLTPGPPTTPPPSTSHKHSPDQRPPPHSLPAPQTSVGRI